MSREQLIVITGARNTGKSTMACTYAEPTKIGRVYLHDTEGSQNHIVRSLEGLGLQVGRYVSVNQERFSDLPSGDDLLSSINRGELPWVDRKKRDSLITYYEWFLDDLDRNMTAGEFDTFIVDTLEQLEAGMAAWVTANKPRAGVTTEAYGRLWTNGVYPLYQGLLSAIWARGVDTIILTSHLKSVWENNRPVLNKVTLSGKKLLYKLSSLMMWLVNEPRNADGAPAGLVIKERMGRVQVVDGQWSVRRMLPRRIPHCTWRDIREYMQSGCDLLNPEPGESLSQDEMEMISPMLSDKQVELMLLEAQRELVEQEQAVVGGGVAVQVKAPPVEGIEGDDGQGDEVQSTIEAIKGMRLDLEDGEIRERLREQGVALPVILRAFKVLG